MAEDAKFKCRFCEREFNMKPHLVRHITTLHKDEVKPGDPEAQPSKHSQRKAKAQTATNPAPTKRRGRPPGTKNKKPKVVAASNGSIDAFASIEKVKQLKAELAEELAKLAALKKAVEAELNG